MKFLQSKAKLNRFYERISQNVRSELWFTLLEELLMLYLYCQRKLGQHEAACLILAELSCRSSSKLNEGVVPNAEKRKIYEEQLFQVLESTRISKKIAFELHPTNRNLIQAQLILLKSEILVTENLPFQLLITSNLTLPIEFDKIVLVCSDRSMNAEFTLSRERRGNLQLDKKEAVEKDFEKSNLKENLDEIAMSHPKATIYIEKLTAYSGQQCILNGSFYGSKTGIFKAN